ncbi:hypothetical protein ADIARSV_0860 [Arcticibacter svalbardensis MN12-7]|uniref:Uncharacterized protein n=1 Tax=Arcticibacter svalbardensis MN12-7 TaxID=1150600 RepID=R9GWR3_9SPHI|nr:hypothetical protein ADIARSV_0860 [Arcticibacter svalbardensis MN12-7]
MAGITSCGILVLVVCFSGIFIFIFTFTSFTTKNFFGTD